jgi:hypothetical protein
MDASSCMGYYGRYRTRPEIEVQKLNNLMLVTWILWRNRQQAQIYQQSCKKKIFYLKELQILREAYKILRK